MALCNTLIVEDLVLLHEDRAAHYIHAHIRFCDYCCALAPNRTGKKKHCWTPIVEGPDAQWLCCNMTTSIQDSGVVKFEDPFTNNNPKLGTTPHNIVMNRPGHQTPETGNTYH